MNNKKAKYFIILLALSILIIYLAFNYALKAKNEVFYPTIINTIPPVKNDLEKILHDLETILKDKNTTAYNSLNQGLSTDDIYQLEVKYNVKIPEEIKSLYMWHNGCSNFKDGLTGGAIIPGHWFVPLEQALELSRKSGQSNTTFAQNIFHECFAGHRKDWIVLFDDGCGDGYFYDPERLSGSGYVFYHFAEIVLVQCKLDRSTFLLRGFSCLRQMMKPPSAGLFLSGFFRHFKALNCLCES